MESGSGAIATPTRPRPVATRSSATAATSGAAAADTSVGSMVDDEALERAKAYMPSTQSLQEYADAHGLEAALSVGRTPPEERNASGSLLHPASRRTSLSRLSRLAQ